MQQRSYYYLRLDDNTVLPVLLIIPKHEDIIKIEQDSALFQRIIASACLQLKEHISVPLSTSMIETPIHVTTDEYHIRISRIKAKSQVIIIPTTRIYETFANKDAQGSLTQRGFVEKFVEGWIPKFCLLRQMNWNWELIITLLHFIKDSTLSFHTSKQNDTKKRSRTKKGDTRIDDYINKSPKDQE